VSQGSRPTDSVSYKFGFRLLLLSDRLAVAFLATEHHSPLVGSRLQCLVSWGRLCEQLACSQSQVQHLDCYTTVHACGMSNMGILPHRHGCEMCNVVN